MKDFIEILQNKLKSKQFRIIESFEDFEFTDSVQFVISSDSGMHGSNELGIEFNVDVIYRTDNIGLTYFEKIETILQELHSQDLTFQELDNETEQNIQKTTIRYKYLYIIKDIVESSKVKLNKINTDVKTN